MGDPMPFRLEKDMYATTLEHLPAHLTLECQYAYGLEVPLSHKVADIGFIPYVGHEAETPEARSVARLRLAGLWALARMAERKEITVDEFWSFLGSSVTDAEKERMIDSLCMSGVLERDNLGTLTPTRWLTYQLGPIIFVELKVSRWEEALSQACFYLTMADMACVVLDGESSGSVPCDQFEAEGIGLFAAWSGHVDVLVVPRPSERVRPAHRNFNRLRAVQDLMRRKPRKWTVA